MKFLEPGCWLGDPFAFPRALEGNVGTEGLAGSKPGWRDTEDKARRQETARASSMAPANFQEGRTKGVWAGAPPSKVEPVADAASHHPLPPPQEHSKSLGMARGARAGGSLSQGFS